MTRWRSSMTLLAIAVVAMVIGFLRVITEPTPLPPGSSYSAQPDGALALYTWLGDLGAPAARLTDPATTPEGGSLLVVQPVSLVEKPLLDAVADRGGTIVLAGDSLPWVLTVRNLGGITIQPTEPSPEPAQTPDGLQVPLSSRYRLHADGAQPLLVRRNGEWAALRVPYRQGTLMVIASADPLTNVGLADANTARFVFRDVVSPLLQPANSAGSPSLQSADSGASAQRIAFDEIDRPAGGAVAAPSAPSLNQLLFATAPGRAVLYAAVLLFVFLLLAGRRLGPAVLPSSAGQSQRTMYEHVQMLADLYRRAGQFAALRDNFSSHYAHQHPAAAARIAAATTERDLIAAVAAIDDSR